MNTTVIRCSIDYILSFGDVFYHFGDDGLDSYEDKLVTHLSEVVGRNMDEALHDALSSVQVPEDDDVEIPEGTLEALRTGEWKWDDHSYSLTKKLEDDTRLEIHFRAEALDSDEWLPEPEEDAVKAMIPKLQEAV